MSIKQKLRDFAAQREDFQKAFRLSSYHKPYPKKTNR